MSDLEQIQSQVLDPKVVKIEGGGKAYQAVSNSMAITVQDATDYLRTMSVITQAASAFCIEKIVVQNDDSYVKVLKNVEERMLKSIDIFTQMGTAAATVLGDFGKVLD